MTPGETWLAFAAASALVLAVPGPTVLLVVAYALRHGRVSGLWTVPGVALGDATALTASLAGVGALLAASPPLFQAMKGLGAAYLIYLGLRLWRHAGGDAPADGPRQTGSAAEVAIEAGPAGVASGRAAMEAAAGTEAAAGRRMLASAYAVTALNPKSIAFFVAFLPQFVRRDAPVLPQLALLGTTFVTLAALNAAAYAVLAGTFDGRSGTGRLPALVPHLRRLAAAALIAAGVLAVVVGA